MDGIVHTLAHPNPDILEWQLRCDMAAAFRVQARHGWNEQIGNHDSLMPPGEEPRFLINPRGLLFQELTASSLIVCDLDGRCCRAPASCGRWPSTSTPASTWPSRRQPA